MMVTGLEVEGKHYFFYNTIQSITVKRTTENSGHKLTGELDSQTTLGSVLINLQKSKTSPG